MDEHDKAMNAVMEKLDVMDHKIGGIETALLGNMKTKTPGLIADVRALTEWKDDFRLRFFLVAFLAILTPLAALVIMVVKNLGHGG